MKKCPYCAEEIKDEAIRCRYCRSDLPAAGGVTPAASVTQAATSAPSPVLTPEVTPATTPVVTPAATPATTPMETPASTTPVAAAAPAGQVPTFTHSGKRFILGYAPDYYGIWDRLAPGPPLQRYALNDEGWRHAWLQFVAWEPAPVPVNAPAR